ncbi:MAG: hypothetical protein SGBAC_003241, partial [Bacillariaceae sp.]
MLAPPGSSGTRKAYASNRRKTVTVSPDELVRQISRNAPNKRCADCGTKLPQCVNLTHVTFICMACSGIHRELNNRIKGLGHSAFTEEEAQKLKETDNDKVNRIWLARYDPARDRMKVPRGNQDQQHLRAWIRRKYADKTWYGGNGTGGPPRQRGQPQPTRAQIPPKPAAATPDLLGGFGAPAPAPTPAPAPQQQGNQSWDAFGGSNQQPQAQSQNFANFGGSPAKAPPNDPFASGPPATQPPQQQNNGGWDAFGGSGQNQQQGGFANFNSPSNATNQPPNDPFAAAPAPPQQQPPQQQQPQNFANFGGGPPAQPAQQQFGNFGGQQQPPQQQQMPPQQMQQQQMQQPQIQQPGVLTGQPQMNPQMGQQPGQNQQPNMNMGQPMGQHQQQALPQTQNQFGNMNVQQPNQNGMPQMQTAQPTSMQSAPQAMPNPAIQQPPAPQGSAPPADPMDAFSHLSVGGSSNTQSSRQGDTKPEVTSGDEKDKKYKEKQVVAYKSNGKFSLARIEKVHLDDELTPYYTIKIEFEKEKQTDNAHLQELSPSFDNVLESILQLSEEDMKKVNHFLSTMPRSQPSAPAPASQSQSSSAPSSGPAPSMGQAPTMGQAPSPMMPTGQPQMGQQQPTPNMNMPAARAPSMSTQAMPSMQQQNPQQPNLGGMPSPQPKQESLGGIPSPQPQQMGNQAAPQQMANQIQAPPLHQMGNQAGMATPPRPQMPPQQMGQTGKPEMPGQTMPQQNGGHMGFAPQMNMGQPQQSMQQPQMQQQMQPQLQQQMMPNQQMQRPQMGQQQTMPNQQMQPPQM